MRVQFLALASLSIVTAASTTTAAGSTTTTAAGSTTTTAAESTTTALHCKRCVAGFVMKGGCKALKEGKPVGKYIPPGCEDVCPTDAVQQACDLIPDRISPCEKPPFCAAGVSPSLDDKKCPTCVPEKCFSRTDVLKQDCKAAMSSLGTCDEGVKPTLSENCCLTCKPSLPPINIRPDAPCACGRDLTELSVCEDDVKPMFNKTTCCRDCRPQPPKKRGKGKCSRQDVKECLETMPDCEGRETPKRTKEGCCKTCRRPQERCSLGDVVKQCRKTPKCGPGELPSPVEGSCCFSCVPAPVCKMLCEGKKVCTRKGCASRKAKKVAMRVSRKVWKAIKKDAKEMKDMTEDDRKAAVKALLEEVVARFCENAGDERAKVCEKSEAWLEAFVVKAVKLRAKKRKIAKTDRIKEDEGDDLEIEVDTLDEIETGRRLLAGTDLLDAALNDKDSTEDLVEAIDAETTETTTSSSSVAGVAVASFLAAWLL